MSNGHDCIRSTFSPIPDRWELHENTSFYKRPLFRANIRVEEKSLIQIVHSQIASIGLCDPEELTDLINKASKELGALEDAFDSASECVEFLSQRSFLFEKRVTDRFFRNTGFAHREGIVNITRFIQENSFGFEGCLLSDLLTFVVNRKEAGGKKLFDVYDATKIGPHHWNDSCFFLHAPKPTEESIREILLQYPEYFYITESFVSLTSLAFHIPSLWYDNLLPARPTTSYYDRSRLDVYPTAIRQCIDHYAKAVIWAGPYRGRRIFILKNNIGLKRDMRRYIPSDTPAFVLAHMTIGHKNELSAIKAVPFVQSTVHSRQTLKEMSRTGIDLRMT